MSDLPRLLFCCFDVVPAPSAISRRLTEYLKGLSERFQVVVLSVKTPDHPHIERYHGARLLRVPVGSGDFLARVQAFDRAVRRQLESEEYLAVHFFDPFGGYALAERRAELGYKLVYDACAFPSLEMTTTQPDVAANRRFVAKARRQELFCLMNADAVIVGNPLTRDWVSTMGVEAEHIHLLPAPVDLALYTPESMGRPDSSVMKVLHVGSLAAHHGLPLLLEAAALVVTGGADVPPVDLQVTVVGPQNPEWKARLEEQVLRLGLTGKVDFQAPVTHDDLHKVLATADVGLLALEDNERNRVVGSVLSRLGEYLAAGRPVVAADVPAARQLCPADAVSWFQPGDANSLAAALRSLALDPAKRVAMGEAGRAAAEKWDGMKIRADLIAVYTAITGQTVQRVPDEEHVADPNEPTQMGQSVLAAEAGEVTQMGVRAFVPKDDSAPGTNKVKVALAKDESSPGTNKVRTDPAITGPDASTDSQRLGDRPAVMGVPLREEAPIVAGEELPVVPPPPWKVPALEEPAVEIVAGALIEDAPEYIKPLTMPALSLAGPSPVVMAIPIASSPTQIVPALSGAPTPAFVTPISIPLEPDAAVSSVVTPLSLGGDSSGSLTSLTPPPMSSSPTVIEPLEMPTFGPTHALSAPVEDSLRGLPRFSAPTAAEPTVQAPNEASHLVDAQIIAPRRPESGGRAAVGRAARPSVVDSTPTPVPFSDSGVRAAADAQQGRASPVLAAGAAEGGGLPDGRGSAASADPAGQFDASRAGIGSKFDAQGRDASGPGREVGAQSRAAGGVLDASGTDRDVDGRSATSSGVRAAASGALDASGTDGDVDGRSAATSGVRAAASGALDASGTDRDVDGRSAAISGVRAAASGALDASGWEVGTQGRASTASGVRVAAGGVLDASGTDVDGRSATSSGVRAAAGGVSGTDRDVDGRSATTSGVRTAALDASGWEVGTQGRASTASGVRVAAGGVLDASGTGADSRSATTSGVRTAALDASGPGRDGDAQRSATASGVRAAPSGSLDVSGTGREVDAQGRASTSGVRVAPSGSLDVSDREVGAQARASTGFRAATGPGVGSAAEIDAGRAPGGSPSTVSGVRPASPAPSSSSPSAVRAASGPLPVTIPSPAPSATRPTSSTSGVLGAPTAPRSPSGVLPPAASRPSGLQPPPLTASSSPSRPPGVPPPLPPSAYSSSGSRPPALPVPSVPGAPRPVPPLVLPDSFGERASTSSSSSGLSIAPLSLPPISAPTYSATSFPSRPPPPLRAAPADEVLEIADDEVESMESELEAAVVQQIEAAAREEEEVISSDETIQAVDTDSSVPFSGIDPWLAQVVHGYCPPGSNIFDRHVPPTTMPGRDK